MEDQREPTLREGRIEASQHPEMLAAYLLKTTREQLGMSQAQVAKAMVDLGFSWRQTTVAKAEAATRPLRVNELVALASVLGVDARQLIGKLGETWAASARVLAAEARIARAYRDFETLEQDLERIKTEMGRAKEAKEAAKEGFIESLTAFDIEKQDLDVEG